MGTKVSSTETVKLTDEEYERKKAKALKWLDDNFGKHKSGVTLTKEELNKLALEHTPEESRKIAKEFGFE